METIINEKYSESRVTMLYDSLLIRASQQDSAKYEILVDGLKLFRRTTNPELFYSFKKFVSDQTQVIEFLFYIGESHHYQRHILYFGDKPELNPKAQLKQDEFQQLTEKVKTLEEQIARLQLEIESLKRKSDSNDITI